MLITINDLDQGLSIQYRTMMKRKLINAQPKFMCTMQIILYKTPYELATHLLVTMLLRLSPSMP